MQKNRQAQFHREFALSAFGLFCLHPKNRRAIRSRTPVFQRSVNDSVLLDYQRQVKRITRRRIGNPIIIRRIVTNHL